MILPSPALKNVPEDTFVKALLEMTNKVVDAQIVDIKPRLIKGTIAIINGQRTKSSSG